MNWWRRVTGEGRSLNMQARERGRSKRRGECKRGVHKRSECGGSAGAMRAHEWHAREGQVRARREKGEQSQ